MVFNTTRKKHRKLRRLLWPRGHPPRGRRQGRLATITFGYQPKASGKGTGSGSWAGARIERLTPDSRAPAEGALCSPRLAVCSPKSADVSRMLPQSALCEPYVGPMFAYVSRMWPQVGPMLALCWPKLALCWPYVRPILALCRPIMSTNVAELC